MIRILGIVNITRDSFSDGRRYLEPAAAIEHARRLLADGADIIDVGAESTRPDADEVSAEEQIARLTPVVRALKGDGAAVSVDAWRPLVMRHVLALGADFINDVTALADPEAVAAVRDSTARVILMHAVRAREHARAEPVDTDAATIVDRVLEFFGRRISELTAAGMARERLILDPGMGLFIGRDPRVSLAVLRELPRLRALGLPVLVSTSRKSFLGALLGPPDQPRPVDQRGAGTLASELWAALRGASYIRTHDVRALRDGLAVWNALSNR